MKISSYFDMLHSNARSFAIDFDFFLSQPCVEIDWQMIFSYDSYTVTQETCDH